MYRVRELAELLKCYRLIGTQTALAYSHQGLPRF